MLIPKLQTAISCLSFVFISFSPCVFSPSHSFLFSLLFLKLPDSPLIGFTECSLSKYSWIQRNLCFVSVWLNCFLFNELFLLCSNTAESWAHPRPFLAGKQACLLPLTSWEQSLCPIVLPRLGAAVGGGEQTTRYFENDAYLSTCWIQEVKQIKQVDKIQLLGALSQSSLSVYRRLLRAVHSIVNQLRANIE